MTWTLISGSLGSIAPPCDTCVLIGGLPISWVRQTCFWKPCPGLFPRWEMGPGRLCPWLCSRQSTQRLGRRWHVRKSIGSRRLFQGPSVFHLTNLFVQTWSHRVHADLKLPMYLRMTLNWPSRLPFMRTGITCWHCHTLFTGTRYQT